MALEAFKAWMWKGSVSVDSVNRGMFTTFKNVLESGLPNRVTASLSSAQANTSGWIVELLNVPLFLIGAFELRGDLGCGRLFEVQTRRSTKGELGLAICWRSSSASSLSCGGIPAVPAGGDFIWPGVFTHRPRRRWPQLEVASRSSVYRQTVCRQGLMLCISKQCRIDEGSGTKILPPPSIAQPRHPSAALKRMESVYTGQ